jgi:hypothetical protein
VIGANVSDAVRETVNAVAEGVETLSVIGAGVSLKPVGIFLVWISPACLVE